MRSELFYAPLPPRTSVMMHSVSSSSSSSGDNEDSTTNSLLFEAVPAMQSMVLYNNRTAMAPFLRSSTVQQQPLVVCVDGSYGLSMVTRLLMRGTEHSTYELRGQFVQPITLHNGCVLRLCMGFQGQLHYVPTSFVALALTRFRGEPPLDHHLLRLPVSIVTLVINGDLHDEHTDWYFPPTLKHVALNSVTHIAQAVLCLPVELEVLQIQSEAVCSLGCLLDRLPCLFTLKVSAPRCDISEFPCSLKMLELNVLSLSSDGVELSNFQSSNISVLKLHPDCGYNPVSACLQLPYGLTELTLNRSCTAALSGVPHTLMHVTLPTDCLCAEQLTAVVPHVAYYD